MKTDIHHWCVVRTLARDEARAELNLARQGYHIFCPRIRKQVRHARKVSWKAAPLFPGYLFVSIDPARTAWRSIQSTYGVAGLVRFGERPAVMPTGLVERLSALSGPDGVLVHGGGPEEAERLRPGDRVRLTGGVFDEWIGQVISVPDQQRICLLLEAAHRSIEVTVPASSVYLIPESRQGAKP